MKNAIARPLRDAVNGLFSVCAEKQISLQNRSCSFSPIICRSSFLNRNAENEIPSFPFKSDFLFLGHFKLSVLKFSTFLAFGWNYRYILCEITVMCCTASTSVGRKATFLNKNLFHLTGRKRKCIIQPYSPRGENAKKGGALPYDAHDRIEPNRQSQPRSPLKDQPCDELN